MVTHLFAHLTIILSHYKVSKPREGHVDRQLELERVVLKRPRDAKTLTARPRDQRVKRVNLHM
jgi:hypothetical protein